MKEITLNDAKKVIELYPEVDCFIDAHFQQGLGGHNEYWDNSMDLYSHYKKCERLLNSESTEGGSGSNTESGRLHDVREFHAEQSKTKEEPVGGALGKITDTKEVCDILKGTRCEKSFPNYKDGVCYACGGQAN